MPPWDQYKTSAPSGPWGKYTPRGVQGQTPEDAQKILALDALRQQANPNSQLISDPGATPLVEQSNPASALDRAKLAFGDEAGQTPYYQKLGYEVVDDPSSPGRKLLSKDGKLYPMNLGAPQMAASILPALTGTVGAVIGGATGGPPLAATLSALSGAGGEALNQMIGREILGTRQDYDQEEAVKMGAISGALEFAGPAARQIGRAGEAITKNLFGATSKIGTEGLERIFERPEQIMRAVRSGPAAREEARVILGDQLQGLANSYKKSAGEKFAATSAQVAQELGDPVVSIAPIKAQLRQDLLEAGVNPGLTPDEIIKLSPQDQLKLKTPTAKTGTQPLLELYQQLNSLPDNLPASVVLRLRQGIGDTLYSENFVNQSVKGVTSKSERILQRTQENISNLYKGVDPRLAQADAEFSNSLNQYKMLKNGLKDERIEGTVTNLFGKNKEWQRTIIKNMQDQEGGQDILNALLDISVAEKASPTVPGIGAIGGIGVGAGIAHNPSLLAAAPAFSPRIVAEITAGLGRIARSDTLSIIKTMGLQPKFVANYIDKPVFRTFVMNALRDFDSQKSKSPTGE